MTRPVLWVIERRPYMGIAMRRANRKLSARFDWRPWQSFDFETTPETARRAAAEYLPGKWEYRLRGYRRGR